MSHTDAKWERKDNLVVAYGRGTIASIPSHANGGVFEWLDNARLIAAAPELLAALKAFVDPWEKGGVWQGKINYATYSNARRAIAKAIGKAKGDY
jgi:hypothetical protein